MHPRVHWCELQPGSCTCSTVQRDWEVHGSSQLHPVTPHCWFFWLYPASVYSRKLAPTAFRSSCNHGKPKACCNHHRSPVDKWGFAEN